jgi:hypothetical protein
MKRRGIRGHLMGVRPSAGGFEVFVCAAQHPSRNGYGNPRDAGVPREMP